MTTQLYPTVMTERRYWATPASSCFMGNTVDADILPFLKKINARHWMVTTSCCSGHGDKDPYVSVAVKVSHIKNFVALLNRLQQFLDTEDVYFACELTFENDIATSCDFENFPDWIMFHVDFLVEEGFQTDAAFWERVGAAL